MINKIYILSDAIQSGKTTALYQFWEKNKIDFDGFLTPDIEGKRKLIFLDNGKWTDMEVDSLYRGKVVEIGKFTFSKTTFDQAKEKLSNIHLSDKKWIVIDEIGKLELMGSGLEPAFTDYLRHRNNLKSNLILVVRDYLLEKVVEKYQLNNAEIISINQLKRL